MYGTGVCAYNCHIHSWAWTRGGQQVSCFITLNIIPLGHGLSLLDWQTASASNPLPHQSYRCMAKISFTCGCLDLNSGPHACIATAFTHWVISQPQTPPFDGDSGKELSALLNRPGWISSLGVVLCFQTHIQVLDQLFQESTCLHLPSTGITSVHHTLLPFCGFWESNSDPQWLRN